MYDPEKDPMYLQKKETEREQFEQFELPLILEEERNRMHQELEHQIYGETWDETRSQIGEDIDNQMCEYRKAALEFWKNGLPPGKKLL